MIVHTQYLGNQELLKLQKTAFLASGNICKHSCFLKLNLRS